MIQTSLLSTDSIDSYYEFTNKYDSYSDLNFTSLLTWCERVEYLINNDGLMVIFEDYESNSENIVTGLTSGKVAPRLINSMLNTAKEKDYIIDAIPEVVIRSLDIKDRVKFRETIDQADYMYIVDNQLNLTGSRYSWYRRKLSIFNRQNGENTKTSFHDLSQIDNKTLEYLNKIWKNWSNNINPKEINAIDRYIRFKDSLKNQAVIIVEIDNKIEAFCFIEIIKCKKPTCLIHYFKSNNTKEGLANYLFQQIAIFSKKNKIKLINFEQDVGKGGLRLFKSKLSPDYMLKKYTLVD